MTPRPELSQADAATVLATWNDLWPPREDFRARLARHLRSLLRAQIVTVNSFTIGTGERDLIVDPPERDAHVRERRSHTNDILSQHPVALHFLQTGQPDVLRLSDHVEVSAWCASEIYREYYLPLGLTWEIVMPIPTRGGRVNIITVNSANPFEDAAGDFSDRDVELCAAMVPIATLGCGGIPEGDSDPWLTMAAGWLLVRYDQHRVITHVSPADPEGELSPGVELPVDVDEPVLAGSAKKRGTLSANGWFIQFVGSSPTDRIVAMRRTRDVPCDLSVLTARQSEVLTLIAEGLTNLQIARRLGISEGTARKHVEAILQALGARNRAAAAAMWLAASAAEDS